MNRGLWTVTGVAIAVGTGITIAEQLRLQAAAEPPRMVPAAGGEFQLGGPGVRAVAAPTGLDRRPARSQFQGTVQTVDPATGILVLALRPPATGTLNVRVDRSTQIQRQVTKPVSDLKVGESIWVLGQPTQMEVTQIGLDPSAGPPAGPGPRPGPILGGPGGAAGGVPPGSTIFGGSMGVPARGRVVSTQPLKIELSPNVQCTLKVRPGMTVTHRASGQLKDLKPGEAVSGSGQADATGLITASDLSVGDAASLGGFGNAFGSGLNGGSNRRFGLPGRLGSPGRLEGPQGVVVEPSPGQ
jgi:hypothetical protein